jgi:hypothetical protein
MKEDHKGEFLKVKIKEDHKGEFFTSKNEERSQRRVLYK